MNNSSRQIVKIIKEICFEHNFDLKLHFSGWVMQISYINKNFYILGYQFQNNNSASSHLCDDKSALSHILNENKIPSVKHEYFMTPLNKYNISIKTDWSLIYSMLDKYGAIVCKLNTGTGGNQVYKVRTKEEADTAVKSIFKQGDLSVCPYYTIDNEYRIIVLNGKAELIYKKEIPYVIGNGIKTFAELCTESNVKESNIINNEYGPRDIVPDNTKVYLSWKHNLALGANASIVTEVELVNKLTSFALKAAATININFASVDIVEINHEFYILEINSGIVLEKFSLQSDDYYEVAKKIYEKAVVSYFEES